MSKVDLHVHTTASDGLFTPVEIVKKARQAGIAFLGICDHDSTDGLAPALIEAEKSPGTSIISGVEINTDIPEAELHILGYLCNFEDKELNGTLAQSRDSRVERAQRMVSKLNNLGCDISFSRVREIAGRGSLGRPHIAQALLEKGYVTTIGEAFDRFLNRDGPAYVEKDKLTPFEATDLIVRAGGIPVMAHPLDFRDPEPWIRDLQESGLAGIEVYYRNYTPEQISRLLNLVKKYDLIATGGSDFHGFETERDYPLGTVRVPITCVEQLMRLANTHKK